MAEQTEFLQLVQPAGGEAVEVRVLNENATKIDDWAKTVGDQTVRVRNFKGPSGSRDTVVPAPLYGDTYLEMDGEKKRWIYDGSWKVVPGLYLELTVGSTAINGSTETALGQAGAPWTEVYDPLNWHDPTTNPTQVKPTIAGDYLITIQGVWAVNSSGQRFFNVRKNSVGGEVVAFLALTAITGSVSTSGVMTFNGTSDVLDVTAWQNAGASLAMTSARITMQLIRAT